MADFLIFASAMALLGVLATVLHQSDKALVQRQRVRALRKIKLNPDDVLRAWVAGPDNRGRIQLMVKVAGHPLCVLAQGKGVLGEVAGLREVGVLVLMDLTPEQQERNRIRFSN